MELSSAETLYERLRKNFSKKQLIENAPMSRYTTLRLGGPAELLCEVSSPEQLAAAFQAAQAADQPVTLLGNGSNLLIRDGGLRGLVIHIGDGYADISDPIPLPDGRFALTAQAGATLQKLANLAADSGLTGLEFASGIPGTVGGAVFMNAGAYGGEMKNVVENVTVMLPEAQTVAYNNQEMDFGYRRSRLSQEDSGAAITSVTFVLPLGDRDTIRATMREFSARRREKQPLTNPSCGSTFKRPEGQFAGTLIDQAGLKGFRIGGACVSPIHAGFLVNDENGTAEDYLALIAYVQRTVQEQTGILLEPEVRILGENIPPQAI